MHFLEVIPLTRVSILEGHCSIPHFAVSHTLLNAIIQRTSTLVAKREELDVSEIRRRYVDDANLN